MRIQIIHRRIWGRLGGGAGLVVEVDGDIHDLQQEEDAAPLSYGHPPIFAS